MFARITKTLLALASAACAVSIYAASPSYENFNSGDFVRSVNNLKLKGVLTNEVSGAKITAGTITTNAVDQPFRDLLDAGGGISLTDATNAALGVAASATNTIAATSLTGTIDDARLPATISSDITGNSATTVTASNLLAGIVVNPVSGALVTNVTKDGYVAVTTPSFSGGLLNGSAVNDGSYGFSFTANSNIVVTSLGRWIVAGNSNRHALKIWRTNDLQLLGMVELETVGRTAGQFAYAELPMPVILEIGVGYAVTSYEGEGNDQLYQVGSSFTTLPDITAGYGVGYNTPRGFSGWAGQSLGPVNFKFTRSPSGVFDQVFGVTPERPAFVAPVVKAGRFAGSLEDTHAWMPMDLSLTHNIKTPFKRVAMFNEDYANDILPNESNVIAYAIALRTNGMAAAGWNVVCPDDLWFLAVNTTNGAVITNMSSFSWTGNAGSPSAAGANIVPTTVLRDGTGLMFLNTNTFPGGHSNLVYSCATNGVFVRWYTPFKTNLMWFSNEVARATQMGHLEMFVDITVGGETWPGTTTISESLRRIIRTFQSATLNSVEAGSGRYFTITNRGMRLNTGGQANDGNGNSITSLWFSAESINGINGYFFSGEDVTTLSNTVTKAEKMLNYRAFCRPGHGQDFQYMAWSAAQSAAFYQSKLNIPIMAAADVDINPGALYRSGSDMWVLTNSEVDAIHRDLACIPFYHAISNATHRLFVRPLGSEVTTSNAICFINLNSTNFAMTLNVTNFGGVSNVTYTLRDPWNGTNTTFVNEHSRTVSPTNSMLFVATAENVFTGNGSGLTAINGTNVTIDASGFNGNLDTTDNTAQKVSQKLDDLVTGGSSDFNTNTFTGDGALVRSNAPTINNATFTGTSNNFTEVHATLFIATNFISTAGTNYGSSGRTNWTTTTSDGFLNTNVNGGYVRAAAGVLDISGAFTGGGSVSLYGGNHRIITNDTAPGLVFATSSAVEWMGFGTNGAIRRVTAIADTLNTNRVTIAAAGGISLIKTNGTEGLTMDQDGVLTANGLNVTNVQATNIVYALKMIQATNYTILPTDVIIQGRGTNQLVTLLNATTAPLARFYTFTLTSTNNAQSMIITNATGAQDILSSGTLSQTITNGQSLTIYSDGVNWR